MDVPAMHVHASSVAAALLWLALSVGSASAGLGAVPRPAKVAVGDDLGQEQLPEVPAQLHVTRAAAAATADPYRLPTLVVPTEYTVRSRSTDTHNTNRNRLSPGFEPRTPHMPVETSFVRCAYRVRDHFIEENQFWFREHSRCVRL